MNARKNLVSREAIVTEIKRLVRWAIEERRAAQRFVSDDTKREHRRAYHVYLLCAWNMGRILR